MGFSSLNDYLNKVTNLGQIGSYQWQKQMPTVGVFAAGRWYNMAYHLGNPMLQRPGERLANGQLMGSSTGWTLGATTTYSNYTLVHTAGANATSCTPVGGTVALKKYALEYWLSAWATANISPSLGGTAFTPRGAAGQWHEIVTTADATDLIFTSAATGTYTLQNISLLQMLVGVPLTSADMGAQYLGGSVSPATKHMLFSGIVSAAANFVPGTWKLVDMLMAYPVDMSIATAQTLDNTEHAINGAFASNATWVWGAAWHWNASLYADKDTDGVETLAETTTIVPVAGKVYNITFTVPAVSVAGGLTVGFGGATDSTITSLVAGTTYTKFITATGAGDLIFTPTVSGSRFTLDNVSVTIALPRYSNGAGVRAMVCWNSGAWQHASNATSAVAHNYETFQYTNSANTPGKLLPVTVAGYSGGVPAMSQIDHSGTLANNIGPFLPLASGDAGIQSLQSFKLNISSGANNYATIILCKELMTLPNSTVSVASERDLMNQIRNLPQIYDGANLAWIFMAGASTAVNTSAYGYCDYVWG